MCASYWSIETAILTCPFCKATSAWKELQTHFYGGDEGGMCWDHYKLGRPALPLRGIQQMILDGDTDGFIGQCPKCHAYVLKSDGS